MNRYLLKGIALLLVLPCIHRADESEDQAVRSIQAFGGEVIRDDKAPGHPVCAVRFRAVTGIGISGLGSFHDTNAGLKHLAPFKELRGLDLNGTLVTSEGIKEVASLKQLRSLELGSTKLADADLTALAPLKQLEELSLAGTEVTDAGIKALSVFTRLRVLDLSGTKVTDAALKELVPLVRLQVLMLMATKVTGAAFNELAPLARIAHRVFSWRRRRGAGACGRGIGKRLLNLGRRSFFEGLATLFLAVFLRTFCAGRSHASTLVRKGHMSREEGTAGVVRFPCRPCWICATNSMIAAYTRCHRS
jgi:hypothetical protein